MRGYATCSHSRTNTIKTVARSMAIKPVNGKILWHIDDKYITTDMERFKVLLAVHKAFDFWGVHFAKFGITFESTSDIKKAPIIIRFAENGDPILPQKFGVNDLAYAFYPDGESLGDECDMYFNDAVDWAEKDIVKHGEYEYDLFGVIVHELGHAFGLNHSDDKLDIMFWRHIPNREVLVTADTLEGIEKLYSPRYGVPFGFNLYRFLLSMFPKKKDLEALTKAELKIILLSLNLKIKPKNNKKKMASRIRKELRENL